MLNFEIMITIKITRIFTVLLQAEKYNFALNQLLFFYNCTLPVLMTSIAIKIKFKQKLDGTRVSRVRNAVRSTVFDDRNGNFEIVYVNYDF